MSGKEWVRLQREESVQVGPWHHGRDLGFPCELNEEVLGGPEAQMGHCLVSIEGSWWLSHAEWTGDRRPSVLFSHC